MAEARAHSSIDQGASHDTRTLAETIAARAAEIRKPSEIERALPLAHALLALSPAFGGAELKDSVIADHLKKAEIGVATFKKALTRARIDMAKTPSRRAARPRNKFRDAQRKAVSNEVAAHPSSEPAAGIVSNKDRSLL